MARQQISVAAEDRRQKCGDLCHLALSLHTSDIAYCTIAQIDAAGTAVN